jgi:hypothetical protein
MGFIGFAVKLVHIPINNILVWILMGLLTLGGKELRLNGRYGGGSVVDYNGMLRRENKVIYLLPFIFLSSRKVQPGHLFDWNDHIGLFRCWFFSADVLDF